MFLTTLWKTLVSGVRTGSARWAYGLLAAGSIATMASAAQLDTIYTAGNGLGTGTLVYFDLNVTTGIDITSFDVNISSVAGTAVTLTIFRTAVGSSYVGNTTNASAFTQVATGSGTAAGPNLHTPVDTTNFTLAPGLYGIAIRYDGASHSYTNGNGTAVPGSGTNQTYTAPEFTLLAGASQPAPFTGTLNQPRVWNGTIYYNISDPSVTGACCTAAAACTFGTAGDCSTSAGFFSGQGTSCTPNVCPHRGACCSSTNIACTFSNNGAAGCATGTTYQGDGTSCSPNICPQGACCNTATGLCTLTSPTGCTAGTFQTVGSVCTPSPCPRDLCCNNTSGACTLAGAGACPTGTTRAGVGTTCTPSPCPRDLCCNNTSGSCTLAGAGACPTGTTRLGVGTTCTPNPCSQEACCNALSGACTLAAPGNCASGTTGQGTGTLCTPTNPCPQPPPPSNDECTSAIAVMLGVQTSGSNVSATSSGAGVVATNTGSCTQTTLATGTHLDVWYSFVAPATTNYTLNTCGSGFDTILSIHSGCPANFGNILDCNDDSTAPVGNVACTDSGLRSRIQSVALTAGQTFYIGVAGYNGGSGAFNLIVNFVDPASIGSCCVSTACTLTSAPTCSGTFALAGACSPNPCGGPSGVCCRGATCSTTVVSAAACTSSLIGGQTAGASFPAGAACNSGPVSNAPCCFADYNKTGGITVNDIFDFLGDWFAGSPYANTGGTGAAGSLSVQNIFDFLTDWFTGGC